MNRTRQRLPWICPVLAFAMWASSSIAQDNPTDQDVKTPISLKTVRYRVMTLPDLGGLMSEANGINNHGVVVGRAQDAQGVWHAARWQDGQIEKLDGVNAVAINDRGWVAGDQSGELDITGKPLSNPFLLLDDGNMETDLLPRFRLALGSLKRIYGTARGINQAGDVALIGDTKFALIAVLRAKQGRATDLGSLGGGVALAYGLNDQGAVVGYSKTGNQSVHGFLWRNGQMIDLGTLGGRNSGAHAVNDHDQVVGSSSTATEKLHAFLWDEGSIQDLKTLGGNNSNARMLNDDTAIVGDSETKADGKHGFLWHEGQMKDLNSLLNDVDDYLIRDARSINASWQIAAIAEHRGKTVAVRLDPINGDGKTTNTTDASPNPMPERPVSVVPATKPVTGVPSSAEAPKSLWKDVVAARVSSLKDNLAPAITYTSAGSPPAGWTLDKDELTASKDLSKFAYICTQGQSQRAVIDGKATDPQLLVKDLQFSPDGSRVVYSVHSKGQTSLILDGKTLRLAGSLVSGSFHFSRDSKHHLYSVSFPPKQGRQLEFPAQVVRDGKDGIRFGFLCSGTYSPDGTRYAHAAVTDGTPVLVVNDKVEMAFAGIPEFPFCDIPVFSPDSQRVAFIGTNQRGREILAVNGKVVTEQDKLTGIKFSPDSQHVACITGAQPSYQVLVDGKPHTNKRYSLIYKPLQYSPDGKHLAYSAVTNNTATLVIDGVEQFQADAVISVPDFSPNGLHTAVWVKKGETTHLVVDGDFGPGWDAYGSGPVFSPDSTRVAYSGQRDKRHFVVVDDQESPAYEDVLRDSLTFSADGNHLAYWAKLDSTWRLIVDGQMQPETFEHVIASEPPHFRTDDLHAPSIHFAGSDHFRAIAVRGGGKVVRIDARLGAPATAGATTTLESETAPIIEK